MKLFEKHEKHQNRKKRYIMTSAKIYLQQFIGLVILVVLPMTTEASIKWIGIKNFPTNAIWTRNDVCKKSNGLTWRQTRFCQRQFPWMLFTKNAAKDTVDECQTVLKHHDWNCQSIDKAPAFNTDLKKDTKESAFVHALSASTLALTVARGCMAGKLDKCTCLQRKQQINFPSEIVDRDDNQVNDLVGCKGILSVGQEFSRDFLNAGIRLRPKTERHRMEIAAQKHNVNLGLKALDQGEKISCQCNGATAGCTVKFCHRRLVLIQDVTNIMLAKYEKAVQATKKHFTPKVSSFEPNREVVQSFKHLKMNEKVQGELVYLDQVDHCTTNKGVYSSTGRRCSNDKSSLSNCDKICCGKGHRVRRIEIHSKCNCKFVYCCDVKCQTCIRFDEILECL